MKKKKLYKNSILNIILFFVINAVAVAAGIMIYNAVALGYGENSEAVFWAMLGVICLLSIITTVANWVHRKFMVERPVLRILDATDKIAKGDFTVRLDIAHSFKSYNEYDYIMENLNKMTAQLAKTEVLHTDFISNVSHEIKTPLAVIQNCADYLQKPSADSASKEKYAQTLSAAAKRLTALINNVLKLNKLENNELKPEYEEFDLTEAVAQAVIGFEDIIEEKGISLECDLEENVKIVSLPSYLETVWNNLLSNAVKFTPSGGKITVAVKRAEGKAKVTVSDTGCGISAEKGERIFDKFYQGDASHSQEGNGLGLALVKKVIDVIGGEISVDSEEGRGTTFCITLGAGCENGR